MENEGGTFPYYAVKELTFAKQGDEAIKAQVKMLRSENAWHKRLKHISHPQLLKGGKA